MSAPEWLPDTGVRTLAQMRERNLGWLADIVEDMLGGDPFQEGSIALEILEAYREHELHMEA